MTFEQITRARLQPVLDHHDNLDIEISGDSFRTVMPGRHPNMFGNFSGGDMAYAANAAASLACVADGIAAETASINTECLSRADGDALIASATIIKKGRKLVRTRVDIYVRKGDEEKLVAIAQINMVPLAMEDIPVPFQDED